MCASGRGLEELANATTAEAVLRKMAEARREFEKMIRYIEKEHEDRASREEAYDYVVKHNLAVTLGAMLQLTALYKQQTYRLWTAGRVARVCRCPDGYSINREGNDCFYRNHRPVITPPPWAR